MNEKTFQTKLRQFIKILKREQKMLINDDGEALNELVPQKEDFLPVFNDYTGELGQQTQQLIKDVQELQQTNLLLTQQAIAYQQKMMETIQYSLEKKETTYNKNAYTKAQPKRDDIPAAILDQSF